MVFPLAFQDLRNVVAMFGHTPGIYEDVIDRDDYELVEKLPENLVHEILEYGGGIEQSIRYNALLIVLVGVTSGLPLIPLTYPDEVIGRGVFSVLGALSECSRRGPPSVDFAIDSGVGMGIVYILSILIRYLSIQLSILLSIIWCKNK